MCFSANASFISGALLVSSSVYCFFQAYNKNKHYILFSLIPIFFGIQQLMEGIVWTGINTNNSTLIQYAAFIYLFFVHSWSFYIPLSLYFIEENTSQKNILKLFIILGLILGIITYVPLAIHETTFTVTQVYGSLRYETNRLIPLKILYTSLYLFITLLPFFVSSFKKIRILGSLYIFSMLLSFLWFQYSFSSVWCFFSALISLYIMIILFQLKPALQARL